MTIRDFNKENGFEVDAAEIHSYYESKGWLVGKAPMKDWKAAIRCWVFREGRFNNTQSNTRIPDKRRGYEVTATSAEDYEGAF